MPELAEPAPAACGPAELLRLKAEYVVPCVYHFYRDPPQIVAGDVAAMAMKLGARAAAHCAMAAMPHRIRQAAADEFEIVHREEDLGIHDGRRSHG